MKQITLLISLAVSASVAFNSCGALLNAFKGQISFASEDQSTAQPTAVIGEAGDYAEYEIIRDDRSFYDEATGLPLIEVYYDLVQISAPAAVADAINTELLLQCEAFFSQRDSFAEYLNTPYLSTDAPFMSTSGAEVTNNAGGVLSIRTTEAWFMGGVFNLNHSGMTFDLTTGRLVTLKDLCPEKEAELRAAALAYMDEAYGDHELGDREETLAAFALEEIPFYIQDGQIVLAFPTYTFASGVAGATVIETGIYID